jgi:membrane-associated phospholipid phosphatase
MRPFQRKAIPRCSLIALSFLLGVVIRFWNFDSLEISYDAALQRAAVAANLMPFLQLYSHIGDTVVWIGLVLFLFAFYWKRPRKPVKFLLFVTVVAVITIAYRLLFPRVRPYVAFPSQIHGYFTEGTIPSYPSGHIAPSAGGFYLLANHSRRLYVLYGALAVLLGASRVATGTHYFTDVIGAALFSYPIAAMIDDSKLFERFKDRHIVGL